jgi:ribonuclease HII
MRGALARLPEVPGRVVVDGLPVKDLGWEHEAIVDGDAKIQSIAAASVLAKLVRDRLMARLACHYPRFCWDANKGYGTAEHLAALDAGGPTPHHRRSFTPVVQLRML